MSRYLIAFEAHAIDHIPAIMTQISIATASAGTQ